MSIGESDDCYYCSGSGLVAKFGAELSSEEGMGLASTVCPVCKGRFRMSVDTALSLEEQARLAVGKDNLYNIQPSIPFTQLRRAMWSGGVMFPHLLSFQPGETLCKAALRFVAEGYLLGDIGENSRFMAKYPKEVEKYGAVFALDEGSRWEDERTQWKGGDAFTYVTYTNVEGMACRICRHRFDRLVSPRDRALVFKSRTSFLTLTAT